MTMLTPMGRGGQMYRRRRRWPKVLAVLLVVALVAATGASLWWYLTQQRDSGSAAPTATPPQECRTPSAKPPKQVPPPAEVPVRVLNGTDQAGLAVETGNALLLLGFDVTALGNASRPLSEGVAMIRYGKGDLGAAVRLASFVRGAELRPRERPREELELTLGPEYDGVATPRQANRALDRVALPTPDLICP